MKKTINEISNNPALPPNKIMNSLGDLLNIKKIPIVLMIETINAITLISLFLNWCDLLKANLSNALYKENVPNKIAINIIAKTTFSSATSFVKPSLNPTIFSKIELLVVPVAE